MAAKPSIFPLRFSLSGIATLLAVLVSSSTLDAQPMRSGSRLALALLPLPFALWMVAEYVRMTRCADEFQRRIILESLAIAWPAAMVLGMTFEYLQKAGFGTWMNVGRMWPLMALLWVPALVYAHWRYR